MTESIPLRRREPSPGIRLRISLVMEGGTLSPVFDMDSLRLHFASKWKGSNTVVVITAVAGSLFFTDEHSQPGSVIIEAIPVELPATFGEEE